MVEPGGVMVSGSTTADAVLTALSDQLGRYQVLAKLAAQQRECVQSSQTEQLLDVLRQRQTEIDRIGVLEQTLSAAKKQWPAFLETLSPGDRKSAESLLGQTRALLEQITQSDRMDSIVLQQRKANLNRDIGRARVGATVNRSYAAAAYAAKPSRVDIQQ